MPKFTVMFSHLVRETSEIKIDAASKEEAKAKALKIYEEDNLDWNPDPEWGAEDGTHFLVESNSLTPFSEIADVTLPEAIE